MSVTLIGALLCIVAGVGMIVIEKYNKNIPQDNILEEVIEDAIKKETGLDIDLSPQTEEELDEK